MLDLALNRGKAGKLEENAGRAALLAAAVEGETIESIYLGVVRRVTRDLGKIRSRRRRRGMERKCGYSCRTRIEWAALIDRVSL